MTGSAETRLSKTRNASSCSPRVPGEVNLRDVQILLGYSRIENTVRNLGIHDEDARAPAKNTEI